MGHPLRNFWRKNFDRVRSGHGAFDVIIGTTSNRLFKVIVLSAKELIAIDWIGDIMNDLGKHMTKYDL